jgi:hypothetical protein
MRDFIAWALPRLRVDKRLIGLYCAVYFIWGFGMDWFGAQVEIARFTFWWQVITCYILYMIPTFPIVTRFALSYTICVRINSYGILRVWRLRLRNFFCLS